MNFHRKVFWSLLAGALVLAGWPLAAQDAGGGSNQTAAVDTNLLTPGAVGRATMDSAATETNAASVAPAPATTAPVPESSASMVTTAMPPATGWLIVGDLLVLGGVGGVVAWSCGLTRARHCGHSCTLLICGVVFALLGFWLGGFAVQSGGLGDVHAALPVPPDPAATSGLNHELGVPAGGQFWGVMGSAGFFLTSDTLSRNATASLFFGQAVLLALGVAVALGGALERARILALAVIAFLIGAIIYPLIANWTWGGGWLAELGREGGQGHGLVDLGGAGVIHLTAGVMALVLAIELGPRYGRFGRRPAPIPGHNLPLAILGSLVLLLSLVALNATAWHWPDDRESPVAGLAAANTLLGAAAGLAATFVTVLYKTKRLDPVALCRGMLGGAVAVSAGAALEEPWAAVLTGAVAGLLVQVAMRLLDGRRIDDPVGAAAVHGAGGAWGLIALGLFANGPATGAINGVEGPVRGLFTAHDGRQLLAQIIGVVIIGGFVYLLGYVCVSLTHKIMGIRVEIADETGGLDEPKLGVLGYQADAESEKE